MKISFHRIWGVSLRYLYLFKRSLDRQTDAFYWPSVDLVLWGLTSTYFAGHGDNASRAVAVVASGIVLWIIVWRGQYEITVNVLEEIWDKKSVNLFVSPLKLIDWMLSFVILGFIKALFSLAFAALLALFLYHVNLFPFSFKLLPFLFLLIMVGWWVGFMVAALILRFGGKVQQFAWSLVYLISPFSAIYYPLSVLPMWAQKVALVWPTSCIFECARQGILTGQIDNSTILIALILNIVFLILGLILFNMGFRSILNKGLVKFH